MPVLSALRLLPLFFLLREREACEQHAERKACVVQRERRLTCLRETALSALQRGTLRCGRLLAAVLLREFPVTLPVRVLLRGRLDRGRLVVDCRLGRLCVVRRKRRDIVRADGRAVSAVSGSAAATGTAASATDVIGILIFAISAAFSLLAYTRSASFKEGTAK